MIELPKCSLGERATKLHESAGVEVEHVILMDADRYELPVGVPAPGVPVTGLGLSIYQIGVHTPVHINGKVLIVHKEDDCMKEQEEDA